MKQIMFEGRKLEVEAITFGGREFHSEIVLGKNELKKELFQYPKEITKQYSLDADLSQFCQLQVRSWNGM